MPSENKSNVRPLVTVGLPVVSDVKLAEHAVRSVFSQTEQDWELIIVCDGAASDVVVRMRQISDPRVKLRVHETNRGLAHRLNEIALLARGPYLARMDADDIMHPRRLAVQLARIQGDKTIDVLGTGSFLISNKNEVCGDYLEPKIPVSLAGYLVSGVFSHPTVMMRTEWARANKYDAVCIRTEDKELWLRTAAQSHFEKLNDQLLYCRVPVLLSVPKQALTAKWDRKLLREKGPMFTSRLDLLVRLARSHAKQAAFWLLCKIGMSFRIHRTKYREVNAVDMIAANVGLSTAISATVPGWD